jgi:hypothetical protein
MREALPDGTWTITSKKETANFQEIRVTGNILTFERT